MTFLAPGFLVAAAVAGLIAIGLHFLSTRDPKLEPLPTARFLPDLPVRATSTTARPADPWLLLLRVLIVMLAGVALARPVLTPPRDPLARIVAVDVSRAVRDTVELADSAGRYLNGAAAVIVFDSIARDLGDGARGVPPRIQDRAAGEAAPWLEGTMSRGSLTAAFVAAGRAAARIRDRADSLELVVVSPFLEEEYDAATERVRGLWPGRVTTVVVAAARVGERRDSVRIEWADSVAAVAAARSGDTGSETGENAILPRRWTVREPPDTVAAVRAGDVVLVYPFLRRWELVSAGGGGARVIARWADGDPAGIEYMGEAAPAGPGCVRSFGFALPVEGDALLRPEFQRFVESLSAPCGEPRDFSPLSADVMAALRGTGPLAAAAAIERRVVHATPAMPWLLLAAALMVFLERVVRRRSRGRESRAAVGAARGGRSVS